MDPVAVEAGLSLILEVVFEMVLLGLYAIPAVYFIPMPGILANVSGRGFDLIAPRNVSVAIKTVGMADYAGCSNCLWCVCLAD